MKELKTKYKGVYTRETQNGTSYIIDYYYYDTKDKKRKKKRETIGNTINGMTLFKAHKHREELVQKLKEEQLLLKNNNISKTVYEVSLMSLNEVFDNIYKQKRHNKQIHKSYDTKVRDLIGSTLIKDITDEHRSLIINTYRDINKSTTITHILAILKSVFNLLIQEDLYQKRNVFKLTKQSRKELPKQQHKRRLCSFTTEEIILIRNELKDIKSLNKEEYIMLFELLISTGGRVSTVLKLRLSDLTIERSNLCVVELQETKTESNVTGYLQDEFTIRNIREKQLYKNNNDNLFTISYATTQRFFKTKIFDKLFNSKLDKNSSDYDYKKRSLHCLRHTFGTQLAEQKANIKTIMNLMGHKRIATTELYLKSNKKIEKEEVIKLLNNINSTNTVEDFYNTDLHKHDSLIKLDKELKK